MKLSRRNIPDRDKRFVINCIDAQGEDIQTMCSIATEITRPAFLKHVDKNDLHALEYAMGFRTGSGFFRSLGSLHASSDPYIQYFSSFYQGIPCVYLVWSAIEYIFT